ncbi:MAG: hypothetical protein EXS13_10500 [Planctomycetes bacterium]|nr:hypothetical protein [Planctomycetota bacterium]
MEKMLPATASVAARAKSRFAIAIVPAVRGSSDWMGPIGSSAVSGIGRKFAHTSKIDVAIRRRVAFDSRIGMTSFYGKTAFAACRVTSAERHNSPMSSA